MDDGAFVAFVQFEEDVADLDFVAVTDVAGGDVASITKDAVTRAVVLEFPGLAFAGEGGMTAGSASPRYLMVA